MARQTQEERDRDAAELNAEFERIERDRAKRGITAALAELAARHEGRPGWSMKNLEWKWRRWLKNPRLERVYRSLEGARHGTPIDMQGWTERQFRAVFLLAGTSAADWERERWGKSGTGRVHYAITRKRGALREQNTIDALVKWARGVLKRKLEGVE